jgi:hypothetical protein
MDGDEDHSGEVVREVGAIDSRRLRQHVVRLVDDDPMRPADARPQLEQGRQQLGEEARPFGKRNRQQVHRGVGLRFTQDLEDLRDLRWLVAAADREGVRQVLVIAFRIDDAILIPALDQALEHDLHKG